MESAYTEFARTLGATIIELRLAAGYTSQAALADALKRRGVATSEGTVRRWEAGGGVPDAWEIHELCALLGAEPADLIRPDGLTEREIQVLRRARKAARRGLDSPAS
jgi:hypothetical protein